MKNTRCNTRNHRHGGFPKKPSSRNFRTHDIPYNSIFGIHGMSKILDSGCSKKKINGPKINPPIFFLKNLFFVFITQKRKKYV